MVWGFGSSPGVTVGQVAPDFTLTAHSGETVSLHAFRGRQPVVLFFYPKDESPICTREACAFRDALADFVEAGAAVFGISGDSRESHQRFAARHALTYPLLTDTENRVRTAFGVPSTLGLLPGRVTYVIDPEGVVRLAYSAQLAAQAHVGEALALVRSLTGKDPAHG